MLSRAASNAARPAITAAASQATTTAKTDGQQRPTQPSTPAILGGLPRRPVSTVAKNTEFGPDGKVTSAGHIQFQPSETEQDKYGLAPAYGHSPLTGPSVQRERVPVEGQFPDGTPFSVIGVQGPAKRFGDDKPIRRPDHRYDHGELSPEQAEILKKMGDTPIFKYYETSGKEDMNCVSGHQKAAKAIGLPVSEQHPHARPQDLAKAMADMKLNDGDGKPKT